MCKEKKCVIQVAYGWTCASTANFTGLIAICGTQLKTSQPIFVKYKSFKSSSISCFDQVARLGEDCRWRTS